MHAPSKMRAPLVAVAVLVAIGAAGCGSSHHIGSGAPSTTAAAETTTSVASTATTASTVSAPPTTSAPPATTVAGGGGAGAPTAVRYASPVDILGDDLLPVSTTQSGRCDQGSDAIGNVNVYRCFAGNDVYDPCWAEHSGSSVVCVPAPWSASAVRLTASGLSPVISVGATILDQPWGLKLRNGDQCLAAQGAHDEFQGQTVDFYCAQGGSSYGLELLRGVNRSAAVWTLQGVVRQGSGGQVSTEYVDTAWFAGPPPSYPGTGVVACTGGQLQVGPGSSGAGLGHIGQALLFTNTGTSACSLFGYPGVAALDGSGHQVQQAQRSPDGYLGGLGNGKTSPYQVVLAPGGTASSLVEGTDNPAGTATSCQTFPALLVTPPGTTATTRVAVQLPGCSSLQVHPVVPGATGNG